MIPKWEDDATRPQVCGFLGLCFDVERCRRYGSRTATKGQKVPEKAVRGNLVNLLYRDSRISTSPISPAMPYDIGSFR